MKKVVVTTSSNVAGMNIIKELGEIAKVYVLESSIVELKGLEKIKADLYIVASTHKSKEGIPCLTAHAPGNFGKAELGGEEKKLSIAPALYIGEAVRKFAEIKEKGKLRYEVSQEVTHHGPTYDLPIVFVEVGSSEKEWKDKKAVKAAAKVIEHLLDFNGSGEAFVGIGGPHYAPNFTKKVLKGYNFGHICPKYSLSYLSKEMLEQMINKTIPKPRAIVLDWKGTNKGIREKVLKWGEEIGIEVKRIKKL